MIERIAQRWRVLSGQNNWRNLLDPLDIDLRQYIIHYGEMAQATYDTFNSEKASKYAGSSIFARKNLFARVGLEINNPYQYKPTKYLYATSSIKLPEAFLLNSLSREAWCKESNWIGYVAVATDQGKVALGRRDIVVAWRGSIQIMEWVQDFDFPMVSACKIFGEASDAAVHRGWLSMYTSNDPRSPFDKTSARDQVLSEVKRLVREYRNEEISITIVGHSLGAALGTLNAVDIVANVFNMAQGQLQFPNKKPCLVPVTAFLFGSPHVGDLNFRNMVMSMENLHVLRVSNLPDIVILQPLITGYTDVGEELVIDTCKSNFLKNPGNFQSWHNLEVYLHGVAGTQGSQGGFHLEVKRDIALINKEIDALKDEYLIPSSWWCLKNKGMVQVRDGSWQLKKDHEKDDDNDDDDHRHDNDNGN